MAVADKLKAVQVKANLIADEMVGCFEIEVDVHDGVAVLTGQVESEEQKHRAEELAYEADGVFEVENNIAVVVPSSDIEAECEGCEPLGYGPAEGDFGDTAFSLGGEDFEVPGPGIPTSEQFPGQFSDEEVEAEVRDKLASQTEVDISDIRFSVANQMVYLNGSVKTVEDLNLLQDLVLNVRGAMGVCSEVEVKEGEIGTPVE